MVSAETDYLSFDPGDLTPDELDPKRAVHTAVRAPEHLWLVADDGDAIVAGLRFKGETRPRQRHRGEFGLTVVQSHGRQGIGRRMIEILIDWARAGGYVRKINRHVRTDNRTAIRLYRRLGFRIGGCILRVF
jgi:ribosomal protein S18 acetylase RimI-like enzyme